MYSRRNVTAGSGVSNPRGGPSGGYSGFARSCRMLELECSNAQQPIPLGEFKRYCRLLGEPVPDPHPQPEPFADSIGGPHRRPVLGRDAGNLFR